MAKPRLIGIGLDLCICDMVWPGLPSIRDVKKIITGTMVKNPREVDELIKLYREVAWRDRFKATYRRIAQTDSEYEQVINSFLDEAEGICRQLFADGKIEQPRLTNSRHFPWVQSIPYGDLELKGEFQNWFTDEKLIMWNDKA